MGYFVLSGELQYRRRGKEVQKVEQKAWISEPVLWVDQWAHHGGFMGKSSCNLLCLNAKTFQFVAMQYRTAMFFPAQYAVAYLEALNKLSQNDFSELDDPCGVKAERIVAAIHEPEEDHAITPAKFNWGKSKTRSGS